MHDRPQKVEVKFYAGYKGDETPRSVLIEGQEIVIDRILERKKILDPETNEVRREYKIELNDRLAILKVSRRGAAAFAYLPER